VSAPRPPGRALVAAAVVVWACYLAAQNPYVAPSTFDDVVYLEGARSLATSFRYTFAGRPIAAWPPGFPAALAVPRLLGFGSIWAAKLVVLAFVAAAAALIHRHATRVGAMSPARALALTVLCLAAPTGFMWGTRVMSEWPFTALAFAFLLLLERVRLGRRPATALAAGGVLSAAILTRQIGVALAAAAAGQAATAVWRARAARAALPELLTLAVGGVAAVAWFSYVHRLRASGQMVDDYFTAFHPLANVSVPAALGGIDDLFFWSFWSSRLDALALRLHPSALLLPFAVAACARLAYRLAVRPRAADWYVAATIAILLVSEWKLTRYWIPVAPLLLAYVFELGAAFVARLPARRRRLCAGLQVAAVALWIGALLALDVAQLARGNGSTYRGVSYLASPTPASFYVGQWSDVEATGALLAALEPAGAVAYHGRFPGEKYLTLFSRKPTYNATLSPDSPLRAQAAFLVVETAAGGDAPVDPRFALPAGARRLGRTATFVAYRLAAEGLGPR
jgi:hypothetical protein